MCLDRRAGFKALLLYIHPMRQESRRAFTRRQLLHTLAATGAGLLAGGGSYGYLYERHRIGVTHASLPISTLPPSLAGLRIGFITDLHHSRTVPAEDIEEAVRLISSEQPDLIVLGGDYVTSFDTRYAEPVADLLAPLSAPDGVFAILGNHDDDRIVPAALAARGFEVLADARTRVTIRGESLHVAGIRFWTRKLGEIAAVLGDAAGSILLLAHDPRRLVEAARLDVPLVLSGHTHGGQVVLPLVGAVAPRGGRFGILAGTARREGTTMFVSRGVGTVYVPLRLNCPPEVAILTLVPEEPERSGARTSGRNADRRADSGHPAPS